MGEGGINLWWWGGESIEGRERGVGDGVDFSRLGGMSKFSTERKILVIDIILVCLLLTLNMFQTFFLGLLLLTLNS